MSDALPLDLDPADVTVELPAEANPEPRIAEPDAADLPWAAPEPAAPEAPPAELVRYQAYDPVGASLEDLGKIGRVFASSGYFRDAKDAAQCITKILAGRELGIGPFQSVAQFHVVEGKPTMSACLVAAMVKRSGRYDYRPQTSNDEECILDWYQEGELVGQSSFTMVDAQRAQLIPSRGKTWEKYPKAMLFNRALTAGARMYCPDVFGGAVYDPSELGREDLSE